MSSSQVHRFNFNGVHDVRLVTEGDTVWFVAKDLAAALGYSNTQSMLSRLNSNDITTHTDPSSVQGINMIIITESGVYSCILGSDKAEVKSFRRWVLGTVLPTIRKTGDNAQAEHLRLIDDNGRLREELNDVYDFARAVCNDYEQLLKLVRPYKTPNRLRN